MLKKYLPILLLTFVNIIGFTLLIPILPGLVAQYTEPQYVSIVYGALLSSYSFFQFLGSPILGSLSDRYGRRPILFISQLGTLLSWVIFGVGLLLPDYRIAGLSLPLLVIAFSRVTDGITGGNISVAQAWISDVTSKEEKGRTFALMGGIFGFGFLVGPALGGFTSATSLGYMGSILTAFLISLLTLGLIAWQLPESLPEEKREKELALDVWQEINILKQIEKFRHNTLVHTLLNLRIIYALVFASYTTIIILFLERGYNLDARGLGIVLSLIGVFSIVNQIFITAPLSKKMGNLRSLLLGIGILSLGLATIPFLPTGISWRGLPVDLVLFMVNAFFINLGLSIGQPTFQAIITNSVSEKRQGAIMGLDASLLAVGQSISPIMAGALFSAFGNGLFFLYAIFLASPYLWAWWQGIFNLAENHVE